MRRNKHALIMSDDVYHGDTSRVSKSGLDLIDNSPANYYYRYLDPTRCDEDDETAAMTLGKAVHSAILEPKKFDKIYMMVDKSAPKKPTSAQFNAKVKSDETAAQIKDWEAYEKKLAGKIIMSEKDYDICRRLRDKSHAHPLLGDLLSAGHAEQTYHFTEPTTGAPCKIRVDWDMQDFILDIKTTKSAKREDFQKSMWEFRYDVSADFYTTGKELATGVRPKGFIIAALEKKPPFNIGVYFVPAQVMEIGRKRYMPNLKSYMECKASGIWPGYPDEASPIDLPPWAYKHMNENY